MDQLRGQDLKAAFSATTGCLEEYRDTVNALASQTAQVTFRVPTVVCRINDPLRQKIYRDLGLRTVSTTELTANPRRFKCSR